VRFPAAADELAALCRELRGAVYTGTEFDGGPELIRYRTKPYRAKPVPNETVPNPARALTETLLNRSRTVTVPYQTRNQIRTVPKRHSVP
jgi:hypothetical protein